MSSHFEGAELRCRSTSSQRLTGDWGLQFWLRASSKKERFLEYSSGQPVPQSIHGIITVKVLTICNFISLEIQDRSPGSCAGA